MSDKYLMFLLVLFFVLIMCFQFRLQHKYNSKKDRSLESFIIRNYFKITFKSCIDFFRRLFMQ